MHVGQIMLVEAENAEEAIDKVNSAIIETEYPTPDWSDWKQIGGRWQGTLGAENALPYSDPQAQKVLEEWLAHRAGSIAEYAEAAGKVDLDARVKNYDPFAPNNYAEDAMNLWRMKKLIQMLDSDWTSDTGIYDLEVWSASLNYFKGRCELAPEMQYLVMVDFHF
jgi:hypothetical protein